jgi:hypothetical protein
MQRRRIASIAWLRALIAREAQTRQRLSNGIAALLSHSTTLGHNAICPAKTEIDVSSVLGYFPALIVGRGDFMRIGMTIGLLAFTLLTGCVERRFVIESDPPGALVLMNGQPIGATPVDGHFLYYGKYQFTLIKDGYETLQVEETFRHPWYEYVPFDFISENLYPGNIEDVRRPNIFRLCPKMQPRTDALFGQAEQLRTKGRSLQPAACTGITAIGLDK